MLLLKIIKLKKKLKIKQKEVVFRQSTSYWYCVIGASPRSARSKLRFSFPNGRDKNRQTTILKKSITTLSLQNMFRSIIDHRQLQVVHDEFEFHLKLQCELTLLHCR